MKETRRLFSGLMAVGVLGLCFATGTVEVQAAKAKKQKPKKTITIMQDTCGGKITIKKSKYKVKWSVKNKKIATVKRKGKKSAILYGKNPGTTTLTAKYGKKTVTYKVKVKKENKYKVELHCLYPDTDGRGSEITGNFRFNNSKSPKMIELITPVGVYRKTYKGKKDFGDFEFIVKGIKIGDKVTAIGYEKVNGSWRKRAQDKGIIDYNVAGSDEDVKRVKEKISAILPTIFPNGVENYSDVDKCLLLANWLCENCEYDYTYEAKGAYRAVGPIFYGKAVCQGYALAYSTLLDAVSVQNLFLSGNNHAWNQVCVDGEWYNVDVTWMDQKKFINYRCFMKSDAEFNENHIPDPVWKPYSCTSTRFANSFVGREEIPLPEEGPTRFTVRHITIWDTGEYRNR
ncbi:MAG: transglutaminase domain-containing protein [Eubacteriales bacterium]|nr:transglutaminase domain-containing protein [Eubacteriales bacterium]